MIDEEKLNYLREKHRENFPNEPYNMDFSIVKGTFVLTSMDIMQNTQEKRERGSTEDPTFTNFNTDFFEFMITTFRPEENDELKKWVKEKYDQHRNTDPYFSKLLLTDSKLENFYSIMIDAIKNETIISWDDIITRQPKHGNYRDFENVFHGKKVYFMVHEALIDNILNFYNWINKYETFEKIGRRKIEKKRSESFAKTIDSYPIYSTPLREDVYKFLDLHQPKLTKLNQYVDWKYFTENSVLERCKNITSRQFGTYRNEWFKKNYGMTHSEFKKGKQSPQGNKDEKNVITRLREEAQKSKTIRKSIPQIAEEFPDLTRSMVRSIALKYIPEIYNHAWGERYRFLTQEEIVSIIKTGQREIDKYYKKLKPLDLGIIADDFNISRSTVAEILKKKFPQEYDKIWGVSRISDEEVSQIKKIILQEVKNAKSKGHKAKSLAELSRNFPSLLTDDSLINVFRKIAKDTLDNDLYYKLWGNPNYEKILDSTRLSVKKDLLKEILNYKKGIEPKPLYYIANTYNISPKSVTNIAISEFDSLYYDVWNIKKRVTLEEKEEIAQKILETDLTLDKLSIELNMPIGRIWRTSKYFMESNYPNYNHLKRFPQDIWRTMGLVAHIIIQKCLTFYFDSLNIKNYSEIPSTYGVGLRIDTLIPILDNNNFLTNTDFQDILKDLNININQGVKYFAFDYTANLSNKNIRLKRLKYESEDCHFFIISYGVSAPKNKKLSKLTAIIDIKLLLQKLRIISERKDLEKILAETFKAYRRKDLNSLNRIKDELNVNLHNLEDFKKDYPSLTPKNIRDSLDDFL